MDPIKIQKDNILSDQINVTAYLNPHPLDEDAILEVEDISFLPGFDSRSQDDDENGEHPFFRQHNIELYEKIEKIIEKKFRNATRNVWPLLDNYIINSIVINIDYSGSLFSNTRVLAAYNYEDSRPEKGVYYFDVTHSTLMRLLSEKEEVSLKINTTWEHEIIHMIDQKELLRSTYYRESSYVIEKFKFYLLNFRMEGIPEIYYLLNGGIDNIKTLGQAISVFSEKIYRIVDELKDISYEKNHELLFEKNYDFYELGPWIILDLLCYIFNDVDDIKDFILQIISKIENGCVIENYEILKVIKLSINIDTNTYLSFLLEKYKIKI